MGICDFAHKIRIRLFGEKEKPSLKIYNPEKIQGEDGSAIAADLHKKVNAHNFKIEDLKIEVFDQQAILYGKVPTRAEKEKIILTVENLDKVVLVDDRIEVLQSEPEVQFYTVQSGDTLSTIAEHFYGNTMNSQVIFKANQAALKNPDRIYPGQVLRIPPIE